MRNLILFLLFFAYGVVQSQDTVAVKLALDKLEKALIEKDSAAIIKLVHKKVIYGHSNGWVQNKASVLADMRSSNLVYKHFDLQSVSIQVDGKFAVIKEWMEVTGSRGGTDFKITLFVLQQWIKTKKGWQLLFRQSAKQG